MCTKRNWNTHHNQNAQISGQTISLSKHGAYMCVLLNPLRFSDAKTCARYRSFSNFDLLSFQECHSLLKYYLKVANKPAANISESM